MIKWIFIWEVLFGGVTYGWYRIGYKWGFADGFYSRNSATLSLFAEDYGRGEDGVWCDSRCYKEQEK